MRSIGGSAESPRAVSKRVQNRRVLDRLPVLFILVSCRTTFVHGVISPCTGATLCWIGCVGPCVYRIGLWRNGGLPFLLWFSYRLYYQFDLAHQICNIEISQQHNSNYVKLYFFWKLIVAHWSWIDWNKKFN